MPKYAWLARWTPSAPRADVHAARRVDPCAELGGEPAVLDRREEPTLPAVAGAGAERIGLAHDAEAAVRSISSGDINEVIEKFKQ